MSSLWVGIGALVVGAGTSLYSANAQKKASQAATNANVASQDKVNDSAWTAWLMSKGIQPTTPVSAGTIPTAGNYSAINTRLPIWANVNYGTSAPGSNGGMRLVKKGSPTTAGITGFAKAPAVPVATTEGDAAAAASGGGKNGAVDLAVKGAKLGVGTFLAGGDPVLGGVVANNYKKVLDPFGVFCWAAREAYGQDNPKWMQFREWILNSAPDSLRELYREKAPALAERMKGSPNLKEEVRAIMDGILAS